ncbi:hypothetical protein OIE62_27635 [Streptomyces scopuliridis]|uniref:Uncharacterized protein n=2 Tax=Streptomyces scopuliridis TaxID=452529 RepID=A0A2T7TAC3_9ACTN|nr:hypothetical protein [Streptomyces scopuliridis]PVE12124.1 hypothetical protein Y717_06830 [Streptomyces scopuliridis RB72]WSB33626.1 hypothetical protein OG949_12600 [Streptomyces scopuliridis]WSB97900.1 hypothetical protein OG835_13305 [Streptomyces scopuliridis]WSC08397.1 hypothetical protein OIE62_27635 [Streptomyces scopuliridis]
MSLQDDVTAVKRCLDDLVRTVGRLEQNLALLRENESRPQPAGRVEDLVTIPDTPYNSALWTDSDDEGLGVRDRRAP